MGHHVIFLPFGTEIGLKTLDLPTSYKEACHGARVYCTMLTPGFFHFFKQYYFFVLETFKSLSSSISGTYIPLSLPIILYCTTNATIYFSYPNGTYLILVDNVFSF